MKNDEQVLSVVKGGPVLVRSLRGRSAGFQLAYRRLLESGAIREHGVGTRQDPVYVGLPDAVFPERKMTVRLADVCLLRLAGATESEARETLMTAIRTGGEAAVYKVCEVATQRLFDMGLNPVREVQRAFNRTRNGKPWVSPRTEYTYDNKPLGEEDGKTSQGLGANNCQTAIGSSAGGVS